MALKWNKKKKENEFVEFDDLLELDPAEEAPKGKKDSALPEAAEAVEKQEERRAQVLNKILERNQNSSSKAVSWMQRVFRRYPVYLLALLCLFACFGLAGIRSWTPEETPLVDGKGLNILCPQLKECADCFLLDYHNNVVLIDTGEKKDGKDIVKMLKEEGIHYIDALILTHFDKDHIGGAAEVLKNIRVKSCYMPKGSEDSDAYKALMKALNSSSTNLEVVSETREFQESDVRYTIYPPLTEKYNSNGDNNNSLMIKVTYKEKNLLFAGDAMQERMQEFLKKQYDGTAYDFIKVPHHGRNADVVWMILEKCSPSHAVITSSADEPESADTINALKTKNSKVWLTKSGSIIFKITEKGITAKQ